MAPKSKRNGATAGANEDEVRKVQELAKQLRPLQGTSLVSITLPAGGDQARAVDWVTVQQGTAAALKSADTRGPLQDALSAAKQQLERHGQSIATGLVIYAGSAVDAAGKQQKISIGFAPFKAIASSAMLVGAQFDVAALDELAGGSAGSTSGSDEAALTKLLEAICLSSNKVCYGVRDTIQALEAGAITNLYLWEDLELNRIHVRSKGSDEDRFLYLHPSKDKGKATMACPTSGEEVQRLDSTPFVSWIRDNAWVFGIEVEVLSAAGSKGTQFKDIGGIGAMLRYAMHFEPAEEEEPEDDDGADVTPEELGTQLANSADVVACLLRTSADGPTLVKIAAAAGSRPLILGGGGDAVGVFVAQAPAAALEKAKDAILATLDGTGAIAKSGRLMGKAKRLDKLSEAVAVLSAEVGKGGGY